MSVYLLTSGSGDDGDEWSVLGIFSSKEKADRAKVDYETTPVTRGDGSVYFLFANEIEEWPLDPERNP